MNNIYMMITLEVIQCSVKVRGQIFIIQLNVCYHFNNGYNEFIFFCCIMSIYSGEHKILLVGSQKYGEMLTKTFPLSD